jgi:2'-5' RNA ligase
VSAESAELRLFVAVELPGDVRAALVDIQTELRRKGLQGLRWVRPEGIHLTLKFLGETQASRVADIATALAGSAALHPAHTLALGRLGTFGGRNNPRVLWVALEGAVEATHALQASVDFSLAGLGFPKEDRAFSPHLTLARVRPEAARSIAADLAAAVTSTTVASAEISVRELSLMQSTLGPGGAAYKRLAAFRLAG